MILSKNQLVQNIVNEISDNSTGQISPYDIRHNLLDVIDSVHLLSLDKQLNSLNFATIETRSTKAGQHTLDKVNLDGYYSIDNSAFGYAALKSNYQGERNTAIGSLSLGCNIYGEDNVALGFNSAGGNTTGFGNVALGNYTLQNNKLGNFNIAIGHGAGYYVGRNTSKKLFIASHPIDETYVCDNPFGSGLTPLVYGDLDNLKFGIAVSGLHNEGVLQVSGNITPSQDKIFNLGSSNYRFNKAHIANEILLDSGVTLGYDYALSGIVTNTDFRPNITESINIGSSNKRWLGGYFQNLYVSGQAFINQLNTITQSVYSGKTLFLAALTGISSAGGYLSDENIDYGGLVLKASGTPYYVRDYEFIFRPSGYNTISCLESSGVYAISSWNSNISINIADGSHLKTQRVVSSGRLSLVTDSNCYGIYLNDNTYYVSRGNVLSVPAHSSSGHLAGITNVNFLANSGSSSDYGVTYAALESGVSVSQKFLTGSKVRIKDASNSNKDKLRGFELKYFDDSSTVYTGPLSDRFVISSYDNTSYPLNNLIIMKNSNDGAVLGVNNFGTGGEYLLPKTTLNVRSSIDSVIRAAAENNGNVQAALQLVGGHNCLQDGVELTYSHTSGIADLNIYKDSSKTIFMRFNENNTIGMLSSGITNATLTIGTSGSVSSISLRESLSNPSSTAYYGKLYVKPVNKLAYNQSHALYFIDGSGYIHDLSSNNLDDLNNKTIYSDYYENVFGGIGSIHSRKALQFEMNPKPTGNTGLGYHALHNLNSSGNYNTGIGARAASGIVTGDFNTVVGAYSARTLSSGNQNTIIGAHIFNNTFNGSSYNIIIGNSGLGDNTSDDYKFLLGNNNIVLFDGTLGPNNSLKKLTMPSGGRIFLDSIDGSESLGLRNNIIEVIDRTGNDYPDNQLTFRFSGNEINDLLILNHSGVPFTNTPTYANGGGPYAILNGDLRLKQYIRFNDNTSLNSAKFLNDISNLSSSGNSILNSFNNLVVEGYALNTIQAPINPAAPTNGLIRLKNTTWTDTNTIVLVNRDKFLQINKDDYVIAIKINNEYRPLWVSSESSVCECCNK